MDLGLRGKAALVTGGSRGIGKEIALSLAREGVDVAICARNEAQLKLSVADIASVGVRSAAIVADLFEPEDCVRAVDEAVAALGRLDILINNASTNTDSHPPKIEQLSDVQLLERFMGKALASIRCSRAALRYIRQQGGGSIVFVGGTSARHAPASGGGFSGGLGNASVANFAKRLSAEVARDRITVNVVNPGEVKTDRYAQRIRALADKLGVSVAEAEVIKDSEIPIGRMVRPSDIATAVVFFASPIAGAITGQGLVVDGGATPHVVY